MANRDMNHLSFGFEKMRKVVNARITFGNSGAPTLDGPNSKGVIGVTRQATGLFTIQFGVSVNGLNQIDNYIKQLAIEWQPDISFSTNAAPSATGQPAVYRNDLQTGANLAAPTGGAAGAVGSGGTFSAGTYYWKVTAVDANGIESLASAEFSQTLVLNGSASLTWNAVAGAVSYRVYRGSATGAENVVYVVTTNSYTDTNAATQASASGGIQCRPPYAQGAVTIQCLNGSGTAVDPANGEAVFVQFDLGDSTAP